MFQVNLYFLMSYGQNENLHEHLPADPTIKMTATTPRRGVHLLL